MADVARERLTVLSSMDRMEEMLDLRKFLEQQSHPAALLGQGGQIVPLPLEAYQVLVHVVATMGQGKAITVAPVDQMLTTQEAANFLGISRPTVVKLLESGEIPFECPAGGRHRRIRLQDVITYQEKQRINRHSALDEITREAAEAGLYDASPDYSRALAEARHQKTLQ